MTDLERRALLGDQQAQEECTRRGIVLPCPCCKGKAKIRGEKYYMPKVSRNVICTKCFTNSGWFETEIKAISAWNTRPAPPIGRCMECAYKEKATVNAKGYLICPASGMEITDTDFCSYFKSKGGDKNA